MPYSYPKSCQIVQKTVSFQVSPKPSEIIYTTLLNNITINSLCFDIQLAKYNKVIRWLRKKICFFYFNFKVLGIAGESPQPCEDLEAESPTRRGTPQSPPENCF